MSVPKKENESSASNPFQQLTSKLSQEEILQSLDKLFDSFMRDEVAAEYPHPIRMNVWEVYQELRYFFKKG